MKHLSLRARLLLSFALVASVGALAFAVAARFLVPRLFDQRMGGGGMGMGMGAQAYAGQHDALVSAINTAMLIALGATLVCSTVIAVLMSRRTLRSIDELRVGAARLAEGHYQARVQRPNESELAELADDLNHLADTLADTERRRAALIGDVAHEMRTPLTTIGGTLEGFDDGLFSEEELVTAVRMEVGRLQHLAGDLAAVSRAEEGRIEIDVQPGDLAALVDDVVARLRPRYEVAGVRISHQHVGAIPVEFDHDRITQVVTNLLDNALAYTPAGGSVVVATTHTDDIPTITVADNGRGLAMADVERIFERFYRADRHDHSGGTGIGLTISRAIMRAHGGELVAASPGPGQGATFVATLPRR